MFAPTVVLKGDFVGVNTVERRVMMMRLDAYAGEFSEAHAEWVNNVWVFRPESFADFVVDVPVPETLIVLGTELVSPSLYSDDVWERFYAAHWLCEQYLKMGGGGYVDIDWDIEGLPEPVDDGLPDGTVY